MASSSPTILDRILADVRVEIDGAKRLRSLADLRAMIADAPPVRRLDAVLESSFGLIAEIKACSPSVGTMRAENVAEAPHAYEESSAVKAISVLTNERHFGGSMERLQEIRSLVSKPVLRKDFILEEYQVREARAFGADAILLMASVLDTARLKGFHELALELGMESLFEVHDEEEVSALPAQARIVGINSRRFKAPEESAGFAAVGGAGSSEKDFSIRLDTFDLVDRLPEGVIRVAESGLDAGNVASVAEKFHAALVGTSLLRDPEGIRAGLSAFEEALS
ncbi:MAG: indole-3-glycerol-phosphate synthase [Proteobacteria bacterium]|nr:indole-3-glycerol-phosphate synthase [Pseudomonadota bacterium]